MPIPETELTAEVLGNLEIDAVDLPRFKVYEHLNQAQDWIANTVPFRFLTSIINDLEIDSVGGQLFYKWPDNIEYSAAPEFLRFYELYYDTINPLSRIGPTFVPGKKTSIYDRDIHHLPIESFGTADFPFVDIEAEDGFIIFPPAVGTIIPFARLHYVQKPVRIAATINCELNYRFKNLVIYRATRLSALVEEYRPELAIEHTKLEADELSRFIPKSENNA